MVQRRKHPAMGAGLALAALTALAGCGGGGGGTNAGGTTAAAGQSAMGVFVTDRFSDDFGQVFVTLRRVEVGDDRGFHTVFDDAAGRTLNVSALANTAQMLGTGTVSAGSYTQMRVTLDDHLTLVSRGGTSTSAQIDDTVGEHLAGEDRLTVPAAVTAGPGGSNLVVDFDLAGFVLTGDRVKPHLQKADDAHFQGEDKRGELKGTVTDLAAGAGFDLQQPNGQSLPVRLTGATVVFRSSQGTDAALANGQRVEVKGAVDPSTHTVTADTIRIEDQDTEGGEHQGGAEGTVASVNAGAGSFVLTLEDADDFQPAGGTLTVQTTAATVFHGRHGDPAGFAAVAAGAKVEVQGALDAATQTLTASRVELR